MEQHLHDAVLERVDVDWTNKTVTFVFLLASMSIEAVVRGIQVLELSRLQPWGPSNSVNTATTLRGEGRTTLAIEMQSGDDVKVIGDEIAWSSQPRGGGDPVDQ